MIEAPASKSFAAKPARALPATRRISPLIWLNLVCLDAPAVAVSWQWLFARTFDVTLPRGASAALFCTAWLIYLADRFGDSLSLGDVVPTSRRQDFCMRHRGAWLVAIGTIAAVDLVIVCTQLDAIAIIAGASVGAFALLYLMINRLKPSLWRAIPLKEVSIGFIFAAGSMVGLLRSLTSAALPMWLCFATLCSLNCISIAVWERDFDLAQHRVSIATTFPMVSRLLIPVTIALCLTSYIFGTAELALSAGLLAAIHALRQKIEPDIRTALADLVLLTPSLRLLA